MKEEINKVNLVHQMFLYLIIFLISIFLYMGATAFLIVKTFELNTFELWLFAFIYSVSMIFLIYIIYSKVYKLFFIPAMFIILPHVMPIGVAPVLYNCSAVLFVACCMHYIIIDECKSKKKKENKK